MNISKKIETETAALHERLRVLSGINVEKLEKQRETLLLKIAAIDRQFEKVAGLLGLDSPSAKGSVSGKRGKRKRTHPAVLLKNILDTLASNKKGLSQINLSKKTGINYQSLVGWLKKNTDKVRSEGNRKEKRYFLK